MAEVEIQLVSGPYDSARLIAEGEPRLVGVGSRVYYRTGGHTAEGRRIYAPEGEPWPYRETLGWVSPEPVTVGSRYVRGWWYVNVRANGHRVNLRPFDDAALAAREHLAALDRAALRVLRAAYQHRRPRWWP